MAQESCPICKGFGKVHPVIYPTAPPEPPKHEIRSAKSETNSKFEFSNDQNRERETLDPPVNGRVKPDHRSEDDKNRMDGKVDWSSLVFCRCQGEKAGKGAHPAYPHPDIDPPPKFETRISKFEKNSNSQNPNDQKGEPETLDSSVRWNDNEKNRKSCLLKANSYKLWAEKGMGYYDQFDEARQARYRKSPEWRRELKELFGDGEGVNENEERLDSRFRGNDIRLGHDKEERDELRNGLRNLVDLYKRVNLLTKKFDEHLKFRADKKDDRL